MKLIFNIISQKSVGSVGSLFSGKKLRFSVKRLDLVKTTRRLNVSETDQIFYIRSADLETQTPVIHNVKVYLPKTIQHTNPVFVSVRGEKKKEILIYSFSLRTITVSERKQM